MARVNALEAAQQLALKGDIDGARKSLQSLADAGDGAACAALAEIAAFTGDWPAVLRHVALALSRPGDLYSLNVYEDLAMLAARAGKELGAWESLGDIARAAKEVLPVEGDESTEAWIGIAENLARASKRKSAKALLTPPVLAAETRKAKFDSGLQGLDDPKMKKRYPSPTARGNYLYALARGLDFPQGAIQQWDRSALPPSDYEAAEFMASALASAGRSDEAWRIVEGSVPNWWPVSLSQVAPVGLLTDPSLASLMNAEHCATVLRTPRAGHAE